MNKQTIEEGKTLALVAYLTIIGTVIVFFLNQDKKNSFIYFHVRQGLGLWLLYFVLGYVVSGFDSWLLSYSFWIFFAVLFVYGIVGAITGKLNKIPILGEFFQNTFKNLGN